VPLAKHGEHFFLSGYHCPTLLYTHEYRKKDENSIYDFKYHVVMHSALEDNIVLLTVCA
jgi:hypothetical protein